MAHAHSPWRVAVTHAIFATEPAPIWQVISKFDALPALMPELIESGSCVGEGVGAKRTLNLVGGLIAREELIAFHPEQFRYSYAMTDTAGMPWEHYFCTVQLQALGAGQTHLMSTGYFQPREGQEAAVREMLSKIYEGLISAYARAAGTSASLQPG